MSQKSKKGFTIIEVVLVLAIAGLIFLMVFIALPNMQRSQRDTQRRNDYAAFSSGVTTWVTNNTGQMPAPCTAAQPDCIRLRTLLNSQGTDPEGVEYAITVRACGNGVANGADCTGNQPQTHNVVLVTEATCDGAAPVKKAGARNFAIYGYIENTPNTYCGASS